MNDSVKLILILRDPVKRIISDYDNQAHFVNNSRHGPYIYIKNTSLLQKFIFTSAGDLDTAYDPVAESMYDLHIERWFRYFPHEQILILDGENFKEDPLPTLRKCEKFLGLPNIINESMLVFDAARQIFCRKDIGCLDKKRYEHKIYPKNFVSRLYQMYAPHVKRTFVMIRKNFDWNGPGDV